MRAHLMLAIIVASALLVSGCMSGTEKTTSSQTQTQPGVEPADASPQLGAEDASVPLIEDGDSVEIGEMI
jgi:hypothetical protein